MLVLDAALVSAEQPPPTPPQYSLPSARYGLLGPDLHRQELASLTWRTTVTVMP
jgi:hypothetical protein